MKLKGREIRESEVVFVRPRAKQCPFEVQRTRKERLGDTYWLYVVWDPLDNPNAVPLTIQNLAKHLDYAKKEVVAARYYAIPASAVARAAQVQEDALT